MRINAELVGALLWLGAGGFVAWAGHDLGLGVAREPGSGLALFWVGLMMMALSAVVAGRALVDGGASLGALWAGTRWGKVLLVLALLIVYGWNFDRIGFLVGTFALLVVLMTVVDPVDLRLALPVAFCATLGVWLALARWLKIQLPAGLLQRWLV